MNQLLNILIIGILTALFYLKSVPISRYLAKTLICEPSGLEQGLRPKQAMEQGLVAPEVRLLAMHQIRQRNRSQGFLSRDLVAIIRGFYNNEIWSLFNIFTSDKDRKLIIGFHSYDEMDKALPSKKEKLQYLASLQTDGYGSDENRKSMRRPIFMLNDHGTAIQKMYLCGHGEQDQRNGVPAFPPPINWRAFSGMVGLKELDLSVYVPRNRHSRDKLSIFMDDLSHLPSSLEKLYIGGNRWMDQDFNLGQLPPGLTVLDTAECEGMDGILNLCAPHSNLHYVHVWRNRFKTVTGWNYLPPNLDRLHIYRDMELRTADGLQIHDPFGRFPEGEHDALNRFASKQHLFY